MKKIQILGTGCPKCKTLMANTGAAVKAAGIDASIEKVEDIQQIVKMGVMMTPAIVIDGKVVSSGKLLAVDDIAALLGTPTCGCERGGDAASAKEAKSAPCGCGCSSDHKENDTAPSPCCRGQGRLKKAITAALLLFVGASIAVVVTKEMKARSASASTPIGNGAPVVRADALVVYYFHGTRRCQTCNKIEALTRQAVAAKYTQELADGKIVFRSVNMEEAGNEHFVEEFEMTSNAVVMQKKGEFEKLEAVWDFVGEPPKFMDYIQAGIAKFLTE
jgi:small redox-active disulfide protein 2